MRYYIDDSLKKIKGTIEIQGIRNDLGDAQSHLPRKFQKDSGFTLLSNTKNLLLLGISPAEKKLWVDSINIILNPSKNFNVLDVVNPLYKLGKEKSIATVIANHNGDEAINCFTWKVIVQVASYIGDTSVVCTCRRISKSWNSALGVNSNPPLWNWLIRHGSVSVHSRWEFWKYLLSVRDIIDASSFESMVASVDSKVAFEIKKDVNRAYGTTDLRRVTERR